MIMFRRRKEDDDAEEEETSKEISSAMKTRRRQQQQQVELETKTYKISNMSHMSNYLILTAILLQTLAIVLPATTTTIATKISAQHNTTQSQQTTTTSTAAATTTTNTSNHNNSHANININNNNFNKMDLSYKNLTVLQYSSGLDVNVIDLRITHNQLTRCEESSLVGLQRLQNLDLSHNKLMALPAKFFQPVKHTIKKLNLSFNSISVLVPNLFESLNSLEYLDLSHNDITSHWINDRLFENLTQLHYLDLSFNKLTVFSSPATFSSLQQLETLTLQHNELRQVPDTIQYLRYLSSLDLSQNFIHDITNASYLTNCRLLFNLNLESNLLENITRDAFSDLPALKVLNLANNRIHHLDQQAFVGK